MKKKLLITIGILICLSVGTLGTLTYFTTEEKAHNVITSGNIDIELNEWSEDENGEKVPFKNIDGVMPGDVVSKIVEVENTGSNPAWIRVSVKKAIALAADKQGETSDLNYITLDINTADWTEKDGFYYYNTILAPGEITTPLFNTVTFEGEMGNTYQNSEITIDVIAYATQSDNNGTTVLEAAGWLVE